MTLFDLESFVAYSRRTETKKTPPKAPGIYFILDLRSGKHYVGSANDLRTRRNTHFSDLRRGDHHNKKLQHAWNKYGEGNFRFDAIELTEVERLAEREQFYMDSTMPFYNVLRVARSGAGYKHTPEEIEAAKVRQKQRWLALTPEQKVERAAMLGLSRRGCQLKDSTREKMSAAKKGIVKDETWRENLSLSKAQRFIVTSPEGAEFEIHGLARFCREHGLSQGTLGMVMAGKRNHHKGWKCRAVEAHSGMPYGAL